MSKKTAQLQRLQEQLVKLKCDKQDKDENKEIALGTSKLNYLDPRITIGWCKKWDVPIEKVNSFHLSMAVRAVFSKNQDYI